MAINISVITTANRARRFKQESPESINQLLEGLKRSANIFSGKPLIIGSGAQTTIFAAASIACIELETDLDIDSYLPGKHDAAITALNTEEAITPYFCANLQEATARYREALQQNPFAENVPVLVENLRLAVQGKQLCVQDANNELMPVQMQDITRTDILSVTGGKPFAAFFLADANCWELNSMWYQSDYYIWRDERN